MSDDSKRRATLLPPFNTCARRHPPAHAGGRPRQRKVAGTTISRTPSPTRSARSKYLAARHTALQMSVRARGGRSPACTRSSQSSSEASAGGSANTHTHTRRHRQVVCSGDGRAVGARRHDLTSIRVERWSVSPM
eukprot:3771296-Rhodomonas_salina.2